ncbi:Urea active transporter [Yarrowia sp. C11]|nr:Urea active transporter [Yarrowia sp. E02]KAG5371741.1 Urea active transporter [Yarrowia sp. C11]
MIDAPLSQGTGYGVVLGAGLGFCIVMVFITWALRRYQREVMSSEEFSTASRSVKAGLIAASVVSSWTWAATLLQSTSQAYKNGVSGPLWYATGATTQVVLFATLAIELKRRAPGAHTYLEVVKMRFGAAGHVVFVVFALMTNTMVTLMLLTGGSAVVNDLTGMHVAAACILLPLGVVLFTLFGGIKATFITDYLNNIILLVMIILFAFTTYSSHEVLGSPSKVYDLLVERALELPVKGNEQGSYLTIKSYDGAIFFVMNIISGFGTVFLDNGYWNKAIAASPAAALPGYVLGGLAWFAIPWLCATTMGLACLALEGTPSFPGYPNRLSAEDVNAGLALPNAAVALLGKAGAGCALVMVFMAVTSAYSSELISVSTIFTYDIYKGYINPKATGKTLIMMSHAAVVGFGVATAGFAIGLYYVGISMGFLYLLMGIIISAAVIPAVLTLLWSGLNFWAGVLSPPLGFIFAITAWLATTKGLEGEINVDTAGSNMPMLAGNVVALLTPVITIPILTLIFGMDNYDFANFKRITRADDSEFWKTETVEELGGSDEVMSTREKQANTPVKSTGGTTTPDNGMFVQYDDGSISDATSVQIEELDPEEKALLDKYAKIARVITVVMAVCLLVLWPMTMYGTGYVFSKKFFTGWVVVGFIWIFFSTVLVVLLPLWESRQGIFETVRGMYWDCTGQTWKLRRWQGQTVDKQMAAHGVTRTISRIERLQGEEVESAEAVNVNKE